MTVVGDSGPLIHLGGAGRLALLRDLYGTVVVPPEVREETVERAAGLPGAAAVADAIAGGWLVVRAVSVEVSLRDALLVDLDPGESNALALAVELRAALVLVDERRGRAHGERLGLAVKGTLGVLLAAKRAGHLADVGPVISDLVAGGFWVSERVLRRVLVAAGELATE